MAQCVNCGNSLRDGAKFCAKCGTKQEATVSSTNNPATTETAALVAAAPAPNHVDLEQCPACGKSAVPGASTCWACGRVLSPAISSAQSTPALTASSWQTPLPPVIVHKQGFAQSHRLLVIGGPLIVLIIVFLCLSQAIRMRLGEVFKMGSVGQGDDYATSLAVSNDGHYVAIGSYRTVRLLDLRTGGRPWRVPLPGTWVATLAFAPDGRRLAAGSVGPDGRLSVLDVVSGKVIKVLKRYHNGVASLSFGSNNATMFGETGEFGAAGDLFALDADTLNEYWRQPLPKNDHDNSDHQFSVSRDGRFIAAAGGYRSISIWSGRDGGKMFEFDAHQETVACVAYSNDGNLLASGSTSIQPPATTTGTVAVWTLDQTNGHPKLLKHFSTPIAYFAQFSPDSRKTSA